MDVFSNLMVIGECLLDVRRTRAFQKAIHRVVKRGDIVLDVGTGSGILAMFAAKAGAEKIYAIDIASDIARFARKNISSNGLSDKIKVITGDVKKFTKTHPIDVVIMELMDTGLVGEQQGPSIYALRKKGIINSNTRLIPYRYQCAAALLDYDFSFYDFKMPFVIQARNFSVEKHIQKYLSEVFIYKDIDFRSRVDTRVDVTMEVKIAETGNLNALVLRSKTFLSLGQAIWGTTDMNMPVIIPLKQRKVRKGEMVKTHIRYDMGEGFRKLQVDISSYN